MQRYSSTYCLPATFWLTIACNNTSPDITCFVIFSPFASWIFISDNSSHSNNHVNHYLQQIHEHYYMQHGFSSISVLTVWADNCSEQFKSRYQLGWSVLYVNNTTLDVIHLFFFCLQHGKGPADGLGGNCKNAIKAKEKFRRHLPAAIDVYLWLQQNFTAAHSPVTGLFAISK